MAERIGDEAAERQPQGQPAIAEPAPAAAPLGAALSGGLSPAKVVALQRSAGNVAVRAYLMRQDEEDGGGGTATVAAPESSESAEQESEGRAGPEVAPEGDQAEPEHPAPPRLEMDLASGQHVLTEAFGSIKQIVPGSIQILSPDDFKDAYDAIYGATQWSWDAYVVPTYGSLNGFAYDGVNYINTGSAGLHTVVHEMLHNNTAADWRAVVGSRFDEGTTEVLTQEACRPLSVDAPTCYPGESPVVRAMIATGLSIDDLAEAYLNGGAQTKIADWADANCKENWATIKGLMEPHDWAAATVAVGPK